MPLVFSFPKISRIAFLLLVIGSSSCISPFLTDFGRGKVLVSANEPNVLVSSEATKSPKTIYREPIKVKASTTNSGDLITARKNGFQTEQISIIPSVKKRHYRIADVAFSAGLGLACVAAYAANGSNEVVQQVSATFGSFSAIFTYLNAFLPSPGYYGAYQGYSKDEAVKFSLYPDSIANPNKALILLSELTTEIEPNQAIGKYSYFKKTKGDVKTSGKLKDNLEDVEEPIAKLLSGLKLSPGTSEKELKALKKESILERNLEPNLLLKGKLTKLGCDINYIGNLDSVFCTNSTVEWTLTDRNGRAILSKTTKGYGQRNSLVIYRYSTEDNKELLKNNNFKKVGENFVSSGFTLALTDAVRRSANEFLFDPEVKKFITNYEKNTKNGKYELFNSVLKLQKPKPLQGEKLLNEAAKSVVTIIVGETHGSGTVISSDGYILTNAHVCGSDTVLKVKFKNGNEAQAKLVRLNVEYDLALLKLPKTDCNGIIAVESNDGLEAGEPIFVIGTPADLSLSQSISKGLLSGIRTAKGKKFFQTDAAVNSGNSGGAMLNDTYNLIGIPSIKIKGYGLEGLGFAIPSEVAFKALQIGYR